MVQKMTGKEKRLGNFIIDSFICLILSNLIGWIIYLEFHYVINHAESLVLYIIYYVLCEYFTGQTVGKMITKTKIISINNTKPTFRMILLRSILRYNPLDVFSYVFGFGYGTHDYYSKSKVIDLETTQDFYIIEVDV